MNHNNIKYFEEIESKFSKEYGILSLANIENEFDITDSTFQNNYYTYTKIIEKYNLTFIKTLKIKEPQKVLQHFLNYSFYKKINKTDFEIYLFSFYIGTNENPNKTLFDILYSKLNSIEFISLSNILTKSLFFQITHNIILKIHKKYIFNLDITENYFKDKKNTVVNELSKIINNKDFERYDIFEETIKKFIIKFKLFNLSYTYETKNKNENDKFYDQEYEKIDINLLEILFGKDNSSQIKEGIDSFLNNFSIEELLNPEIYIYNKISEKYSNYFNNIKVIPDKCKVIKTILFVHAYLSRNNKDYYPSQRMKNITTTDSRWATGTELTEEPSFYGKLDFAKAFSVYYSFMNGNRNPYYQIINNNKYDYMDEESLKIHKYFRENLNSKLLYDILYKKEVIAGKSIYETLSTISEVIDILESPIIYDNKGLLSNIIGMVTSILNSVSQILDFSLSFAVKSFFYVKFIPIGNENKYSISDLYNYIIFLKLILECAQGENIISNISREKFVSYAYQTLGVREKDIKKIGYCAYDYEMNDKTGLNLYADKLSKNIYGDQFNARTDLKLFYSMLQFAIMKQVYSSKNDNIYINFDFSDIGAIRKMINSLNSLEKYYVFKIYYLNFNKLKDLNVYIIDDIYNFEKNIGNIDSIYNQRNISFYEKFLEIEKIANENNTSLSDEYEYKFFLENINYNSYLNTCIKEYNKKVLENKKNIDKLIFEVNDLTDLDDFFMRFLPSILEVLKLLNIKCDTIDSIINFLDMICYFISDLLFRNIFLKLKFELNDKIKKFEDNMFSKFSSGNYIFTLDIGGESISKRIKSILKEIDDMVLNGKDLRDCFTDVYTNIEDEDYYKFVDGDFEEKINIIYYDKNKNPIKINDSSNEIKTLDISKVFDTIKNDSENKKLIYENNEIYIEYPNGDKIKIVYEQDEKTQSSITTTIDENEETVISKSIVTDTEYETLIEIRDFISNIKNNEIVNIVNKINKIKEEIEKEQQKKIPNNNIIKNLQENYAKLTEELYYAKNKNNVYLSDSVIQNENNITPSFTGSDYKNNIVISSNYNGISTAIEKKELLEEIEQVVFDNNLPLTNYEIIQLLK